MNTAAPSETPPHSATALATLASLIDRIGAYIYIKDAEGRYLFANSAVCELYGATAEQVLGSTDAQLIDLARSPRLVANDRAVIELGEALHDEEELCLHDGSRHGFWTTKLPVRDGDGRVIAVCGVSTALTQRNWAADHLIERNHLLGTVLANLDGHVYLKDNEGRYLFANERVLELYGRTATEVVGKTDAELLPADVAQRLMAIDRFVLDSMSRQACEEIVVGADGQERHYWSIKLPLVRPGQPPCLIGFSTEITELLRLRQTLERQRITDPLTGLPNRVQFEEELGLELRLAGREGRALVIAQFDLDQFKYINTHLGQDAGDQLLREAAARLRQHLGTDGCLARLAGDEFAVALAIGPEHPPALEQVEALRAALAEPYTLLGKRFSISASAGMSHFPEDATTAAQLLQQAEAAMYHAKARGRDQCRSYSADIGAAASQRLELESDLRNALAAGQFELHFQPKVRRDTGVLAGFEALLRWRRPGRGLVPPLEFVPLAEQLGLLVHIGNWVVDEACRQMAAWRAEGLGRISVAVNLSPSQLASPSLIDHVAISLQACGIGPGELEMEVTESMMMEDPEQAIAVLHRLRSLGVRLSIDDFGTGYSSMAYLKRLPVDTLKLDRHFVTEIATDARDADLCAGVIALAHKLGLKVVAEGVETEEQRRALAERDCDLFQGWLFARPMPPSDTLLYLRERLAH